MSGGCCAHPRAIAGPKRWRRSSRRPYYCDPRTFRAGHIGGARSCRANPTARLHSSWAILVISNNLLATTRWRAGVTYYRRGFLDRAKRGISQVTKSGRARHLYKPALLRVDMTILVWPSTWLGQLDSVTKKRTTQEAPAGMVLGQLGVADVIGQDLHRLASTDLLELKDRCALRRALGGEARSQRKPAKCAGS